MSKFNDPNEPQFEVSLPTQEEVDRVRGMATIPSATSAVQYHLYTAGHPLSVWELHELLAPQYSYDRIRQAITALIGSGVARMVPSTGAAEYELTPAAKKALEGRVRRSRS